MISLNDVANTCNSYGNKFYTLSAIINALGLDRKEARRKLGKLEHAGSIARVREWGTGGPVNLGGCPRKEVLYVNKKGLKQKLNERMQQKDVTWDRLWTAARMLRRFTRTDLVVVCNANIENVRYFTKAYMKAGYLRSEKGRGPEKIWAIMKDPGPCRPNYKRV
jgi:hypothetical protein